jgi:thioredoxin reductase (NADPH)
MTEQLEHQKLIIIGSGPAGYTAALYAARANLKPILYEGFFSGPAGGQLMTTTEVENYPGFPHGITGPALMDAFRSQCERFGTTLLREDIESVDLSQKPFSVFGAKHRATCDALIISTGATAKKLDIPGAGEDGFWQKGVTACAICDGAMPIFRNKELYVIGGGDTAVEEAVFLTKYGSKVYIVHRRDELRASKIMAQRAKNHPKIEILWDSVIVKIEGDKVVRSIRVKNLKAGTEETREAAGVFFAIGHKPNTDFLKQQLPTNAYGYLIVEPGTTRTSIEGVFAAGDVQDPYYRQAVTAAGSGCMAAIDAERWLAEHEMH